MSIKQADYPVVINGKTYLLRWKHIALELLESLQGKGIVGVLAPIKYIFFAGLRKHHASVTLEDCAEILDDTTDYKQAIQDIMFAYYTATDQDEAKKKILAAQAEAEKPEPEQSAA